MLKSDQQQQYRETEIDDVDRSDDVVRKSYKDALLSNIQDEQQAHSVDLK